MTAVIERLTEAEIAQARTRLDVIAADVALKRKGRELAGLCPFHNERTPSFYVVPDKGWAHCFGCGWHGDAIAYLMRTRNLPFVDAVHEINGTAPRRREAALPVDAVPQRDPRRDKSGDVQAILRGCQDVAPGTAAYLYLQMRGLIGRLHRSAWEPAVAALRAHHGLYCAETGRDLPALVAPITSSHGVTSLQRIWVLPRVEYDGSSGPKDNRAPLKIRKKTMGEMLDGAVRMGVPGARLGLAEGVETAIAAALCNRGMPVWAACGASRLGGVAIPDGVEWIRIYGDNGETGEELAYKAAYAYQRRGYKVALRFPEARFGDWADALLAREAVI